MKNKELGQAIWAAILFLYTLGMGCYISYGMGRTSAQMEHNKKLWECSIDRKPETPAQLVFCLIEK